MLIDIAFESTKLQKQEIERGDAVIPSARLKMLLPPPRGEQGANFVWLTEEVFRLFLAQMYDTIFGPNVDVFLAQT